MRQLSWASRNEARRSVDKGENFTQEEKRGTEGACLGGLIGVFISVGAPVESSLSVERVQ
jgi:hypothetical protein